MDIASLFYSLLVKPFAAALSFLGINPTHLAAGMFGAAVKSLVDKNRNPLEIAATMFIGALCASYLTPFVNIWIKPDGIEANNGMAFVIGTIGVSLTQYALKVSNRYAASSSLPPIASQFEVKPDDEQPK